VRAEQPARPDGAATVPAPVVELYFDHGCPFSCMAVTALASLAADDPALAVDWRAVPLAGPVGRPDRADAAMLAQHWTTGWPRVAGIAQRGFGLALRRPSAPPDGRLAAVAAGWVRSEAERLAQPALERAFHAATCLAAFEHDRDIAEAEVLASVATAAGLDGGALRTALNPGPARAALAAAAERRLADARAHGIDGVPALRSGPYLVVGVSSRAVFEQSVRQARAIVMAAQQ
jgi:predicted DsbA family dithiol-disulfide isomerase